METFEVYPNKGIGPFRLGMTEDKVVELQNRLFPGVFPGYYCRTDYLDGRLIYRPLYQFDVTDNQADGLGVVKVVGRHRKIGSISDPLKKRLLDNGISAAELKPFINQKEDL